MSVSQLFQLPCPQGNSDESRDDRILEALSQFRHDVMKEIFEIKEVLKESLIGKSESLCEDNLPKTSIFDGDDGDRIDIQRIRSMVDRNIHEPSMKVCLGEQNDSSMLESVEHISSHSIDDSTSTGSDYDETDLRFVSICPTDIGTKQIEDFVPRRSLASLAPNCSTSTMEVTEVFDCDVVSETSPLHNIVVNNKTTTSHSTQENYLQPCAVVSTATNSKDFIKEELDVTRSSLPKHPRKYRIVTCEVCDLRVAINNINTHMRTHKGVVQYTCEYCDRKFYSSSYLTLHRRTCTGHQRSQCGKEITFQRLNDHDQIITKETSSDQEKPLTQRTDSSKRSRKHKIVTCHVCERRLLSTRIKAHMRAVHTGEKPYQCELCGRPFTSLHSLDRHRRIHTGERPYKCLQCGKRFTQSGALNRHAKTHVHQTSS